MSKATERAWAAGLFEGDGNVYVPPAAQGRGLRLTLAQSTDGDEPPAVLIRFMRVVECGAISRIGPNALSKKQRWIWRVQNREVSQRVLDLLAPYWTPGHRT